MKRNSAVIAQEQQGVALIVVLVIVAIATVVAVTFTGQQQRGIRRTALMLHYDQAIHYAYGAEAWAIGLLSADMAANQTDHLGESWAKPLEEKLASGGVIAAQLYDLQARVNINNLKGGDDGNAQNVEIIRNLFANLKAPDGAVDRLIDWIDSDSETRFPNGAEDLVYLQSKVPFLAANNSIEDITELRIFLESEKVSDDLLTSTVALPEKTKININTAPAEVLQAAIPKLSDGDIKSLLKSLSTKGFENREEMLEHPLLKGRITEGSPIDINSSYFLLEVHVSHGEADMHLYTSLHRDDLGKVSVIRRKLISDVDSPLPSSFPEDQ